MSGAQLQTKLVEREFTFFFLLIFLSWYHTPGVGSKAVKMMKG